MISVRRFLKDMTNRCGCGNFMGLNLSNQKIAEESDLNKDDVQVMTTQLCEGVVIKKASRVERCD